MDNIKETFGVFETNTSTWNNGNFTGELIQDGFSTQEDVED